MYDALCYSGQWYVGHTDGSPVHPKGVQVVLDEGLMREYLSERDEYRRQREEHPMWLHDSTMVHAAEIYAMPSASATLASTLARIIYNKGFHGGNRAKDEKLTEEEREETRLCLLCGHPDSQDHWLHECKYRPCQSIRNDTLITLNKHITNLREKGPLERQLGFAFKHILMTTNEPARIWTANWSKQQILEFTGSINPSLLDNLEIRHLTAILKPIEQILADGARNLWHCKVCNERTRKKSQSNMEKSGNFRRSRNDTSPSRMVPLLLHDNRPKLTREQRLRHEITLYSASGTLSSTAMVFPQCSVLMNSKLLKARQSKGTSKLFASIDEFKLHGAMFQRLCGNETGIYYDDGQLHTNIIQAFFRLVQRHFDPKLYFLHEEYTRLICSGNYDKVNKFLLGKGSKQDLLSVDWVFALFADRSDCNCVKWSLACISMRERQLVYYAFPNQRLENSSLHTEALRLFLDTYVDAQSGIPSGWNLIQKAPDIPPRDFGPWLCLAIQLHCHSVPVELLTPDIMLTGRQYIAQCLLDGKIMHTKDMLISQVGTNDLQTAIYIDTTDDTRSPGLFYPSPSDLEGYLPVYNMFHQGYSYTPRCSRSTLNQIITLPSMTNSQCLEVLSLCTVQLEKQLIHCPGEVSDNALDQNTSVIFVEGGDIRDLIQPVGLQDTVVNTLLMNNFPYHHPDVLNINTLVTNSFRVNSSNMLSNAILSPMMHSILPLLLAKRWTIFAFNEASHYVGVALELLPGHNQVRPYFLDSLKGSHDMYIDEVRRFITWASDHVNLTHLSINWTVKLDPTLPMQTQCKYSYPGVHPDLEYHIDCGLYLVLMMLLLTKDKPLELLTPVLVHQFRPYFAYFLTTRQHNIPIEEMIVTLHSHSTSIPGQLDGDLIDITDSCSTVEHVAYEPIPNTNNCT